MESIALAWVLSDSAIIVTPGFAQQASSAAAYAKIEASSDEAVADDATIVVFGNGQTRQVAGLEADDVTILAPGNRPLKAASAPLGGQRSPRRRWIVTKQKKT